MWEGQGWNGEKHIPKPCSDTPQEPGQEQGTGSFPSSSSFSQGMQQGVIGAGSL